MLQHLFSITPAHCGCRRRWRWLVPVARLGAAAGASTASGLLPGLPVNEWLARRRRRMNLTNLAGLAE